MKYITFQDGSAILFSDRLIHSSMMAGKAPMGAGFCSIRMVETEDGKKMLKVETAGRSDSIGIGRSPHDDGILTNLLNGGFRDSK